MPPTDPPKPAGQPANNTQAPSPLPHRIVLEHRGNPIFRILGVIGWIGVMVCIGLLMVQWQARPEYYNTSHGIQERYHSLAKNAPDKVAIIRVVGTIMEGDGFVKQQIDRVREDKNVKAVVVRIDSPGGTVTGSDYIYHHLKKLKEDKEAESDEEFPLVVSMGSMAASGGYYIAMAVGDQEQSIYAEQTTTTGSIGVIIPHYDLSGLLEKYDIKNQSIVSERTPHKQLLSMSKEMTTEERQILVDYVDESLDRFREVVKEGRGFSDATLDELATGKIFTAPTAKLNGLIDEIGFIEDAIDRAVNLAGLDAEEVRVVSYKRPPNLMEAAGINIAQSPTIDPAALLDLTAPRAYYLTTWLPAVVSTSRP